MQRLCRGDIYVAELSPVVGSEQSGVRPVLILQNNVGNQFSPTVIVAAITSRGALRRKFPTHYLVEENSGLSKPSVVMLEQLRTIDRKRLKRFIGHLDKESMTEIDRMLQLSLGIKKLQRWETT